MDIFKKGKKAKEEIDHQKLKEDVARIRVKFPDRIPILVTRAPGNDDLPEIDNKKYRKFLTPQDLTVGQFVYTIRKRIQVPPEKAIFVFVNNKLPPTAMLLSELYHRESSESGFLLMTYSGENTFGSL